MRARLRSHMFTFVGLLGFAMIASPAGAASFSFIDTQSLLSGAPLYLPLDGLDAGGQALTYSVSVEWLSGDAVLQPYIPEGNRSVEISVAGYGDMVFELFEDLAPRATDHIIQLAQSGFYSGVTFHRIIDNFMIQGGDPTGTGSGGSTLGTFDDQFNVNLQHTSSGLLSMAKAFDDGNDSQFFITDVPTRWLDFQHTIFGKLVEGDAVRDAVNAAPTDPNIPSVPLPPVVMSSVAIFNDTENAVLRLAAPEGTSGASNVTVTVTDEADNEYQQTFLVNVAPDTQNGDPFLTDIAPIVMYKDTVATLQLEHIDAEGDAAYYLDMWTLNVNGLDIPVVMDPNKVDYETDFNSGLTTITPLPGVTGQFEFTVAVGVRLSYIDYQVVQLTILPSILGDANEDGLVDTQDFTIMKTYFGEQGADWSMGDFNFDGLIDTQDFTILKTHFGEQMPATVPEPATLLAMTVAGLPILLRRKRCRQPKSEAAG